MCNQKTVLIFLALSLLCLFLFLYFSLIKPLAVIILLTLFLVSLTSIYINHKKNLKKIYLKKQELQEKLNTLCLEIKNKQEYLYYLPESSQRLNFFKTLTEKFIKCQDLENIYSFLGKEIKTIFKNLSVFMLYMIDEDKLKLVSSYRNESIPAIKCKEGDILDYWVLKHNQGLLIEDIGQDFRFDLTKILSLKERVINSLIVNPMSLGEKVIGILRVESSEKKGFNFEDLRILSVISDLASIAIDGARILKRVRELAIKDSVTGLYLRGYFMDRLKDEINRALINESQIGIILADLDLFKNLNDKFGHVVGDLVLRKTSEVTRQVIGNAGNLISRFGGEEFIIFVVNVSKEQARKIAERLRKTIEKTPIKFRRSKIHFTISMGVASFPDDARFLEDLIKKADDALYQAKRKGRNQVCIAK